MPTPFPHPIAHRGLHDRARGIIENSATAFQAALDAGLAMECDLQLSADGEAMVFHDDTTERLLGVPGALSALAAPEIGAMPLLDSAASDRPQTFAQMLEQVAGRGQIVVEIKDQHDRGRNRALVDRAVALVRGYTGPLVFKSFHPAIVGAVRKAGFSGDVGIITQRYDRERTPGIGAFHRMVLRHLLHYPQSRFTFISCEQSALDLPAIAVFRSRGFPVMSWTVRDPDAVPLVRARADQIVFEGFDPLRAFPS